MQKILKTVWFKCLILVLVFAAGFLVKGVFFDNNTTPTIWNLRQHDPDFKYIDPLLLCRIVGLPPSTTYGSLKTKINNEISSAGDNVQKASVYFQNLEKGDGFGINENDQYAPASLLKLPLMIAYFKAYESDPTVLQTKLTLPAGTNIESVQNYKPAQSIQPGKSYSIEDLLNYMIVYSDNNAMNLLDASLNTDIKNGVYTDLGLQIPPQSLTVEFMSAKLYSYFFRILYNATYISPELSEKAMEILIKADFPEGIEGGVPKNIPIAQKFGERKVVDANNPNTVLYAELHSCGIVFYPQNPYIICIMTKGKDFTDLSKLIQNISKTVYTDYDIENKAAVQT